MRGGLCRKRTCTVTVIHYCTDDRQLLIALSAAVNDPADIRPESRFSPTPPAFDAPVMRSPSEYCRGVGTEKLEWCDYPTVKKI